MRAVLLPAAETSRDETNSSTTSGNTTGLTTGQAHKQDSSPVEEDSIQEVEIEDLGDKGDGIARIGPGYIVFVPETDVGERVRVRITDARDNFAFADVVERM